MRAKQIVFTSTRSRTTTQTLCFVQFIGCGPVSPFVDLNLICIMQLTTEIQVASCKDLVSNPRHSLSVVG